MPHLIRKIDMEVSHTLHKNRRIQQNNYSEEKDSVTCLESKRRGPGIPTAGRSKLTWTPGSDNIGRTGMDLKSEVEAWKFMSSIIPSKHQETTHLPKGAWSQNAYANNIGQLTASRREKHPTKTELNLGALKQMPDGWAISPTHHQAAPMKVHKDKNTTSRKRVLKDRDIQETGTKPPNNL